MKVFPKATALSNMKNIDSTVGFYLNDIINTEEYETYVEETLYTSLNQIRFYYPTTGVNVAYIKNGNHVLYPTPTGYNLYTVDSVTITTDSNVLQVDAQHYSVNFMKDSAHEIAVGVDVGYLGSIAQKLKESPYVSEDFDLVGDGVAEGFLDLTEDTYISSLASATLGSLLVGANSFLRKYYGQYIRRNLDHVEAFPLSANMQTYPLVLGVNVRDMDYTVDTTNIYTTAIISPNSVPELKLPGGEPIGGLDKGIGGSAWETLDGIPDGYRMDAVYKGLPLDIKKQGNLVKISLGKLVGDSGDDELISPIPGAIVTYVGGVLLIKKGDTTYLNEQIDPHYFYAINVFNVETGVNHNLQFLGKNEFIGKEDYTYTTRIPAHIVQFPVRSTTETKGNAVKYVDFEEREEANDADGAKNITHFYHWYFTSFKNFWSDVDNKKLLEPTFSARFTVDDMYTLYGEDIVNTHIFRIGDLYTVDAEDYDLQFEAAITKTKYNGLTGRLVEIEFGNKQDLELEALKTTNINKPTERKKIVASKSTSNVTSKPVNTGGGSGNGGFDWDKADEWFEDKIKEEGLTDEIGEWLEKVLNGEDIRSEEDLFNGDLPYETRTDDTGIPRMVWEPEFVTISTDGNVTTPTKLICYNGAEQVISEVKYKGGYDTVRMYGDGTFYSDRTFLPDNKGFQIVPYPETGGSIRTWTPVFNIGDTEAFNKDTEHGNLWFTEKYGSTAEDIVAIKEELGYRYHHSINATTKGIIKFETEKVMFQRYLNEFAKKMGVGIVGTGLLSMYQVKDTDEFKREVLDRIQGQTVIHNSYAADLENDAQSLAYYLKQVEDGDQPYLKSVYRTILRRILYHVADRVAYAPGEVITIGDILKVKVEFTGESSLSNRYKRIIDVDFDEVALEKLPLRGGPFIKEEPGWQRLIFTQPTTKVNDQTVKVNQLLITNGGTSTKNAIISKSEVDKMWAKLSDEERKRFESTYGKEWLFNLKYTPNQYESDDVLFGSFYRAHNKLKPPGIIDPFGLGASLIKQDEKRALKVAERYQQKYNYMLSIGYTIPQSSSGQTIYNKVEAYYKSQQTPIEP